MTSTRQRVVLAPVPPRAVSIPVAADLIGIGEKTLRAVITEGTFPVVRVGDRILVPLAGLDQWIAANTTPKTEVA